MSYGGVVADGYGSVMADGYRTSSIDVPPHTGAHVNTSAESFAPGDGLWLAFVFGLLVLAALAAKGLHGWWTRRRGRRRRWA